MNRHILDLLNKHLCILQQFEFAEQLGQLRAAYAALLGREALLRREISSALAAFEQAAGERPSGELEEIKVRLERLETLLQESDEAAGGQ
ncbi:MAG: hypothetical protein LBU06_12290 [Desulfovibrio sp.]|nr:hypothetical protein [Desulfovibrio sp.]